jgi:hypothetical protein
MNIFIGTVYNNERILQQVLLASRLDGYVVHGVTADTATEGCNKLLKTAKEKNADVALITHQDMYYPDGWIKELQWKLAKLPDSWVVAGFFGMDEDGNECGKIHDRRIPKPLIRNLPLPRQVISIDACAMVFNMKKDFTFQLMEGWDLHDTYACLRAREMGGTAWVVDCMPEHYCTRSVNWKPDENFLKVWEWLKFRFPNETIISTCHRG